RGGCIGPQFQGIGDPEKGRRREEEELSARAEYLATLASLAIFPAVKRVPSPPHRFLVWLAPAALLALPSGAEGQTAPHPAARKAANAVRIEKGVAPPRVDGRLDDDVWTRASF